MPDPIQGDALRGHLQTLVLSVLEDDSAHGFEILRRLEAAGRGALHMKEGSLYPALHRMEKQGLLKAAWEAKSSGRGPRRRNYRLTAKGRRQLRAGREEWTTFVSVLSPIIGATA
ncbi:lineage-specific thermal regulator protein [Posidoniimonas polymericola]|uniref:Lineage-specific thermal regulator protein n=1 Tax=Posidoniimonas polymericola TaxID=2528002 RepID=A0A5C5YFJ7_9BACT|nr:helix-turn-helix transcriptional regulator [Posidoniimonas polymericola]TWT74496.1 lineage-specific thermal regulator protein [Posidoniimonas polymericola]